MMLIVHGGGGVGKSNTTRVCAQWAETILKREYSKQDLPRVLLLCPTGMAASVIDGMTIHSAFDFYFVASQIHCLPCNSILEVPIGLLQKKALLLDSPSPESKNQKPQGEAKA